MPFLTLSQNAAPLYAGGVRGGGVVVLAGSVAVTGAGAGAGVGVVTESPPATSPAIKKMSTKEPTIINTPLPVLTVFIWQAL